MISLNEIVHSLISLTYKMCFYNFLTLPLVDQKDLLKFNFAVKVEFTFKFCSQIFYPVPCNVLLLLKLRCTSLTQKSLI